MIVIIAVMLLVVGFVLIMIPAFSSKRSDSEVLQTAIGFCLLCLAIIVSVVHIEEIGYKQGYEQGQIDALQGKWKYEAAADTVYIKKPE
jgi:uncharacterized membrane protein YfcA